jgi:hypothetical protein
VLSAVESGYAAEAGVPWGSAVTAATRRVLFVALVSGTFVPLVDLAEYSDDRRGVDLGPAS